MGHKVDMVKHIQKLFIVCALCGVSLGASQSANAAVTSSADAAITVTSSCSMTATLNSAHTATLINGQVKEGIGQTTISTTCNDPNGYSIYAVGYYQNIVGAENSNKLVGLDTGLTIATGTSGASSYWAMKVTGNASDAYPAIVTNGYDEYSAVPLTYSRVAYRTSATGVNSSEASHLTTTYKAYMAPTQAADIYYGRVRYALVHPSSAIAHADFDSAFASAGKATYINKAGIDTGYYAMQDMTSAICNSVVDYDTETQLIDTRDEKLYWVLKAEDGKCWMTENLDLDLETNVALTSFNTDLNVYDDDIYNKNLGYTYDESTGLITWTPSSPTYTSNAKHENGVASNTTINWSNTNTTPRSVNLTVNGKDIYQKDGSTFASAASCNYFTTPACLGADKKFNTEPYAANGEHGKIGNYYNWSAAVASNNTSTRVDSTYNAIAENPKNSICPKGWRLTRSSATDAYNDFKSLYAAYSSSNAKTNGYPLWLVRAGIVLDSLYYIGDYGSYWSSTVNSASNAYCLNVYSYSFNPSDDYTRRIGRSVRCVAR